MGNDQEFELRNTILGIFYKFYESNYRINSNIITNIVYYQCLVWIKFVICRDQSSSYTKLHRVL